MAELLRRMLLTGGISDPARGNVIEYSFALEYKGPPIAHDIPRAVPIDIDHIPTAAVISPSALANQLDLPVIHPLPSADLSKATSCHLCNDAESTVSPTSVIAFNQATEDPHSCELSGEVSCASLVGDAADLPGASSQTYEASGNISSSDVSQILDSFDQSGGLSSSSLGIIGFSGGTLASDRYCSSSGRDDSRELSSAFGSSSMLGHSKVFRESLDFSNNAHAPEWVVVESAVSSPSRLLVDSSCKAETDSISKRNSTQHCEADMLDVIIPDGAKIIRERKESSKKMRKGSCSRCLRGNRFTEKEMCIVCNAKYCGSCVLRVMGSMPEGRKCLTCIGSPIDETNRGGLGKCSRILRRLLSTLEVQQVMNAEKTCDVNQIQPDQVFVNGKRLYQEELTLLQRSPNSPTKLKPGRYWYDKVSGFWGKEGHKPCKIVTPHLNVGGVLMQNASNGNTEVFINNREITKAELRMLQWAGVQCAGKPHFWVNADGSYQEEGQKNIRGNIWGKAGVRLVCSVLSLPLPPKDGNVYAEDMIDQAGILPPYLQERMLQRFLVVGFHGSGTSTIFKQARFLYKENPFTPEERENMKCRIQSCMYRYLGILLEGRERFEGESLMTKGEVAEREMKSLYSINPRLKGFSDWLLKIMSSGSLETVFPAATREYAPLVEELWNDAAIQATYSRRNELHMLPDHASYFLERVTNISKAEYEPSDMDILHADGITSSNGLACTDFSFARICNEWAFSCDNPVDSVEKHGELMRYELIRVGMKDIGENCKWVEMFEDIKVILFCVALSDYDQFCEKGGGAPENKMLLNMKLFEKIALHPTFEEVNFLLILNKFDLLEKKIVQVPLTVCAWFHDFHPIVSRHYNTSSSSNSINGTTKGQQAFHYIATKFKKHFHSLTGRKLYVCRTNGLDGSSVDAAVRYARGIVQWEEEKAFLSDNSVYSMENSS